MECPVVSMSIPCFNQLDQFCWRDNERHRNTLTYSHTFSVWMTQKVNKGQEIKRMDQRMTSFW